MAEIKFGLDQFNNPAPVGYRRWRDSIIAILAPTVTLLHEWGNIQDIWLHRIDQTGMWIASLLVAIGIALGNGQRYTNIKDQTEIKTLNHE